MGIRRTKAPEKKAVEPIISTPKKQEEAPARAAVADEELSLFTAVDSLDTRANARPPPVNPAVSRWKVAAAAMAGSRSTHLASMAPEEDEVKERYDLSSIAMPKHASYGLIEPSAPSDIWNPVKSLSGDRYNPIQPVPSDSSISDIGDFVNDSSCFSIDDEERIPMSPSTNVGTECGEARSTFLFPGDIHPNMEHTQDDIAHLRLLAGKLNADWKGSDFMAPALARRIRDFQFAQEKRRNKYGDELPWGILGLYDYLSAIRIDVEWAEDAAWRRANNESYQSWADFNESKKKGYNRPFFTYFILFVCSINMVASIAVNGWQVEPLDVNPMIGPSADTLVKMGAKETTLIVEENEGWRLISSAILHAGLVHFLINMLALWFVGGAIETTHGWFAGMVIFSISAVGGTVLSAIFLPEYITVGASGGIFGFIGACIADIIINWNLLFSDFVTENGKKNSHIMVVLVLFMDIALNSIIGLTPYVDNFTHLGGMGFGLLCGLSTMGRLSSDFFGVEDTVLTKVKHFVFRFFGIIISLVSLLVALAILLNMDSPTTPCPGCTWLSCVPFPPWEEEASKWWYCDDCNTVTASIISMPYYHLEVDCPGGDVAEVNITGGVDREELQKQLPSYCREFCPQTKA